MPDGSTLLQVRYWIVPSGLREQQLALVAVRSASSSADREEPKLRRSRRAVPARLAELELAVGGGERVGLQRVRAVRVALDHLGERVALELGAQVHARRARQVVEPVAVLQVLQLLWKT